MGNALRKIAPALRKLGYVVTFWRAGGTGMRSIRIDTPLSHAARSAHNANDRHNSPDRHMAGGGRDDRDDRDGDLHTQTNAGHVSGGNRANGATCDQPGCGHQACTTGPEGNWCADHMQPQQRRIRCAHCGQMIEATDGCVETTTGEVLHGGCVDAWART
jgi:hypothetical protein